MLIIPAIDLYENKIVRLRKGNFNQITFYEQTPLEQAKEFEQHGFEWLHMLNLFSMMRMIGKPLLGICLGMQLLCDSSKEGNVSCLGIFPSTGNKFDETKTKVPHMGWNKVKQIKESKLFTGISDDEYFYFAHSFYVPLNNFTIATAENGIDFSAALEKDNFFGVQFHPEKSGDAGLKLLENFITLC